MRALTAALVPAAALSAALLLGSAAAADEARVRINLLTQDGLGPGIGTVLAADSGEDLKLSPLLRSLPSGSHVIGIYEHGDCAPGVLDGNKVAGGAAGSTFVPPPAAASKGGAAARGAVEPVALAVGNDGIARTTATIPNLKLAEIKGRALVVAKSRGGERQACGVIP